MVGQRIWIVSERVTDPAVIEAVSMIRKGRVKWLSKGDAVGQAFFIDALFELAA